MSGPDGACGDAATLDVQFRNLVQLLAQVAGHDLGQAGLHATAGDHQHAGLRGQPLQLGQLARRRRTQVDPGRAHGDGRPHTQGEHRAGQRGHDGVVAGHQLLGRRPVIQVQDHGAQFLAAGQGGELGVGRIELACVHVGQGNGGHLGVRLCVERGGRSHQATAEDKEFHGVCSLSGLEGIEGDHRPNRSRKDAKALRKREEKTKNKAVFCSFVL